MRYAKNKKFINIFLALFMAVSCLTVLGFGQHAHAATMSEVFIRFDRMKVSTVTTGTICAMPATTSSDVKTWTVTFPTGYTLGANSTFQSTNISTTNLAWPGSPSAWPNATSATSVVSSQTVTWTNSSPQTMTAGTLYCYNWLNTTGNAVTVKSSATASNLGTIATQDSSAVTIDSGQYATASITDDQIVVTATVPTAFSFALSGNTDALGNLSTGAVSVSPVPRTATVNTNAKNGWLVWANDTQAGLHSANASYTIASNCSSGAGTNSTLSAGTEGYNTGVTQTQAGGSGTITVAVPFVGGSTGKGGGLCTNLQTLASSTGSADTAVLTLTNNAAIKGSTPAATDYTDTLTVVGAGLF